MGLLLSFIKKTLAMGKKVNQQDNMNQKLNLVIRSGKYKIGYKHALKSVRAGQTKLLLIASNCPAIRRTELEYFAILGGARVCHFEGNNTELGTASNRMHRVCVLSIQDPGDSDILNNIPGQ